MQPKQVKARVINLDRRADRWHKISKHFRALPVESILRVSAVDAMSNIDLDDRAVSRGAVACWLSHQVCFHAQVTNSEPWSIVLEDDADFHVPLTTKMIQDLIHISEVNKIDVLQIGWIEGLYRPWTPRWILDELLARRSRRHRGKAGYLGSALVFGEFRAGSHAYLLSKNGAIKLIGSNIPVMLGADAYLSALAQNHFGESELTFARLGVSLVGQKSRSPKSNRLDTDIF